MNLLPPEYEVLIRFNVYCIKTLNNRIKNIERDEKRYRSRFVSYEDLSNKALAEKQYIDMYRVYRQKIIEVGISVYIENELLYQALRMLEHENRKIILLCYFGDMNDSEIGRNIGMPRSTVNFRRNKTLKTLKIYMEDFAYEDKSKHHLQKQRKRKNSRKTKRNKI